VSWDRNQKRSRGRGRKFWSLNVQTPLAAQSSLIPSQVAHSQLDQLAGRAFLVVMVRPDLATRKSKYRC